MTNGIDSPPRRKGRRPSNTPFELVLAGVISVGVAVAIWLAWLLGGADWFSESALRVIGWAGVVISLAGVVIAVLIFRRQTRASEVANSRQAELLGEIRNTLGEVHGKVSAIQRASDAVPDEEDTVDENEVDEWAKDTPDASEDTLYVTSPTGRRRRLYDPSGVPLAVIASLIAAWEHQGRGGKWTVGMLRGAFRAEGKGNHPWFLIFEPRPGHATVWKVSRGPGGTDHASEIATPKDLN